jgi:pantoate--beta-alanine ligase
MKIIETPVEVQTLVEAWRGEKHQIGFVPTMGALHEGHLALARRARAENEKFVASIFVNPLQFRPNEDLAKYPRPFERDCELLEDAGCDLLFAPKPEVMYGKEGESRTFVEVEGVSALWEGAARPGHFRGVATVVAKLFNIVLPHRSYFGEKDFQQLQVLRRMTSDLNFPTEIVACSTVREEDGLALSSRNVYLDGVERAAAPAIYRALCTARDAVQNGECEVTKIVERMRATLASEPLLQVEYLCVVESTTLEPISEITPLQSARALIAVHAGNTRLIDNIELVAQCA